MENFDKKQEGTQNTKRGFSFCVKQDSRCTQTYMRLLCLMFVVLLYMGCASQPEKAEKQGRPLPQVPYVAGAKAYFYATHGEMISQIMARYGINNPLLVDNIASLAVSFTERGFFVFVKTKPKINIATFSKRVRLMKRAKALPLGEDELYWRIEGAGKAYMVNLAYAEALLLSDVADVQTFQNVEFLSVLPTALRMLEVRDDYALWLWASVEVFKNTFAAQKIRDGHAALAIPTYNVREDVSTDFAFPYDGVRSDFATLKLMLPFLFKSIGANILASLPDISFSNNMIMIRGVNLPVHAVRSLARTITSEGANAKP